ncbi:MAG: histidinol-phosphatase HisJ family protein [Ruminococcaceae bacterium]|nr:histidinol-phosphatase HisJ family protein [Oscillospiraceae bacterium]
MFDLHIHTRHSPDSNQTLDEICAQAVKIGLKGIAICDHVDLWFAKELQTDQAIRNCIADVKKARERYGSRLTILQGMEMAEYLYDPQTAEQILSLGEWDVVLGSVHSVRFEMIDDSYSRIDFSTMPMETIDRFLKEYFRHIAEMIEKTDFDVLSHLTCPLRYINGKYHRNADILRHRDEILSIFEQIIQKEIALEINTSNFDGDFGKLMPDIRLLQTYKKMGGKRITLASDAHIPQNIGKGFAEITALLQDIGFDGYCIFRQRKAEYQPF